jgi:hypothetical protein
MGFLRCRRSFKVFPGLRLNLSKSGVSTSIGRRGAWFTIGPRGTRTTVGIQGTGLSYTEQSAYHAGHAAEPHSEPATTTLEQGNPDTGGDVPRPPDSTGPVGVRWPNVSGSFAFLILAIIALAAVAVFAALR